MSSEKANNSPGLSPVKGQEPSPGTQTRSRDWVELQLNLVPVKSCIVERIRILSSVSGPSINSELKT